MKLGNLIPEENKSKKVNESQLNEIGAHEIALITSLGTLITFGAEFATGDGTGGGIISNTIRGIKDAYTKAVKLKPIIDKLDKDPDVQKFVQDNIRKMANQAGAYNGQKWHDVIDKKLSDKEKKYAGKIWATDMPSYKDGDKDAIIAKHDAELKQKAKDINTAKRANIDLDNVKIKNPETGNDISIKSALSYGSKHPLYKSAVNQIQQLRNKKGGSSKKPNGQNIF